MKLAWLVIRMCDRHNHARFMCLYFIGYYDITDKPEFACSHD